MDVEILNAKAAGVRCPAASPRFVTFITRIQTLGAILLREKRIPSVAIPKVGVGRSRKPEYHSPGPTPYQDNV